MAESKSDLLAGAGGLVTDEAQSDHQGRKALLLVRNNEDCSEFIALAETMGINIVERIDQRGRTDPKWFMGSRETSGCGRRTTFCIERPPVARH